MLKVMAGCTLLLIRHAEMQQEAAGPAELLCGWCDLPLSPRGRLQAALLAERLAQEPPPAALYSSPLPRALETARALGHRLRMRVRIAPALREIYCGSLDGRPVSEAQANHPELWSRNLEQTDENFRWPGGESYRELRARVLREMDRIAARHPGARVLVVTHAGVVNQCVGWLSGMSAARWEPYRPRNASVTEIRWRGPASTVLRFDDGGHLEGRADAA